MPITHLHITSSQNANAAKAFKDAVEVILTALDLPLKEDNLNPQHGITDRYIFLLKMNNSGRMNKIMVGTWPAYMSPNAAFKEMLDHDPDIAHAVKVYCRAAHVNNPTMFNPLVFYYIVRAFTGKNSEIRRYSGTLPEGTLSDFLAKM